MENTQFDYYVRSLANEMLLMNYGKISKQETVEKISSIIVDNASSAIGKNMAAAFVPAVSIPVCISSAKKGTVNIMKEVCNIFQIPFDENVLKTIAGTIVKKTATHYLPLLTVQTRAFGIFATTMICYTLIYVSGMVFIGFLKDIIRDKEISLLSVNYRLQTSTYIQNVLAGINAKQLVREATSVFKHSIEYHNREAETTSANTDHAN